MKIRFPSDFDPGFAVPGALTPRGEALRQAVIDAVRAAIVADDSGECVGVPVGEWDALVDAYGALTAPQPMRPEDLEPGQRFMFYDPLGIRVQETFVRLEDEDGQPMFMHADGFEVQKFVGEASVIPITE